MTQFDPLNNKFDGFDKRMRTSDRRASVTSVDDHWHLKKEVPIATILTVLVAIGGGTMWVSNLRTDVDMHWQAFQQHVASEAERLKMSRSQNKAILLELKEMRKDVVTIKVNLARHYRQ